MQLIGLAGEILLKWRLGVLPWENTLSLAAPDLQIQRQAKNL